jgi:hypothetical protein
MLEYATDPQIEQQVEDQELERRVIDSLEQAGLKERLDKSIIDRLVLLEKHSKFNQDSRMIERGMDNLIGYLSQEHPDLGRMSEHRSEARVAAILHDIGKSGPVHATPEEQLAVIKLYAAEQMKDPQQTVEEIVRNNFESEAESMLDKLAACGVRQEMSMRHFWDLHGYWTKDILESGTKELSSRTKLIAASHHIVRGINPYNVPDQDIPDEARMVGALEDYIDIVEERALVAIDQYQASIRRAGSDHEKAIGWVRKNIAEKFDNDSVMHLVLTALDKLGRENSVFT